MSNINNENQDNLYTDLEKICKKYQIYKFKFEGKSISGGTHRIKNEIRIK